MPAILLPDLAATRRLAECLAAAVEPGEVIALDGPLGAGKTTLVRDLVAALGGDAAQVASPTFTLLHQYQARLPVIHVDAYRLAGPADLAGLGFDELSEQGLGVVEWAQRVRAALDPQRLWQVALDHAAGGGRQATVTTPTRLEGKWLHVSSAP
jgi:tRNA threonylcarbamoyl adenosine modification protein YjeE